MSQIKLINQLTPFLYDHINTPSITWMAQVNQGLVSNISFKAGSSCTQTYQSLQIKRDSKGKITSDSLTFTPYRKKCPTTFKLSLTVSSAFQQMHVLKEIEVDLGSTVTILYSIPDPKVAEVAYSYKLNDQEPIVIGFAVQSSLLELIARGFK